MYVVAIRQNIFLRKWIKKTTKTQSASPSN